MNNKRFFGTLSRRFCVVALLALIVFAMAACPGDIEFNIPETPQPFASKTAVQVVADIKLGWNLGNTLDAEGGETNWGNPMTKKSNFTALKNAGFNAVRIPVSWHNGVNKNYDISAAWMSRVIDIVNYAIENDMYVILNTHHDEDIFKFMNSNAAAGQAAFKRMWEQIADTFQNYNEKLIFEALNEPRTQGGPGEWTGGTEEQRNNLNKYYQIFYDTVRESGGNNDKRMLLINPYAASIEKVAMDGLVLPKKADNSTGNNLIVSFHHYAPYNFALRTGNGAVSTWSEDGRNGADADDITKAIDRYYEKFKGTDIPLIIGECGAMNRDNEDARAAWAKFFFSYAKTKGIPCFWWDNGAFDSGESFGLLNRNNNSFKYSKIMTALKEATK